MRLAELDIKHTDHNALLSNFLSRFAHFHYPAHLIQGLTLDFIGSYLTYKKMALALNAPFNYANTAQERMIMAEELNPGLNYADPRSLLNQISPPAPVQLMRNTGLMKATAFVDVYGQVQMEGTRERNKGMLCLLPGIGGCLGVMIKDGNGNITAAHHQVSEQYSTDTIQEDLDRHIQSFGMTKNCLLSLAGISLTKGGLTRLGISTGLYPDLKEIDTEALKEDIRQRFGQTAFSFNIHRGQIRGNDPRSTEMLTTDVLATNTTSSPIVANQYWFAYPLHA